MFCVIIKQGDSMKIFYYFFRYVLILLLGNFVKYLGIPSFYELPYLILIPFNYLAINYGIKHPLKKRNDIEYKNVVNSTKVPFYLARFWKQNQV